MEEEQPEKKEEEEEEDHELRDLVKTISSVSVLAGDFRQQELAKKQYSRMQTWAMAQHQRGTGGGARRRPSNSRAAQQSASPEKSRSPSPSNRGKQAMKKMHHRMEQHK